MIMTPGEVKERVLVELWLTKQNPTTVEGLARALRLSRRTVERAMRDLEGEREEPCRPKRDAHSP